MTFLLKLTHQAFFPEGISLDVGSAVSGHRLDDLDFFPAKRKPRCCLIDSGTHSGALCGAYRAVCVIKLDCGSADSGKSVAEKRAEEHVGVSGVDLVDRHAHLLHDLHAIHE